MKLEQMNKLLEEEKITGIRASWTNREIKKTLKSILAMDAYKNMNKTQLMRVFMKKFDRYIKKNNLRKGEIRDIASSELDRILARRG